VEPVHKMDADMKAQYDELLARPDFLATPHIGGYTVQALYKMSFFLAEKIKKALA